MEYNLCNEKRVNVMNALKKYWDHNLFFSSFLSFLSLLLSFPSFFPPPLFFFFLFHFPALLLSLWNHSIFFN